ncbi:MAG: Crp/Fnr family transcriptional regulator [Leptolyngbyaceae cyanobacterium SM2_5_2]|nr:Crp/Fnr family transcriptional regulator [Leptolyngbyaceae cyanobacterium SM2_5_2]
MVLSNRPDNARPFLTWQRITDWAQEHYRSRTFSKDERIPTRSGLLYLVERGAIRLVGAAHTPPGSRAELPPDLMLEDEPEVTTGALAMAGYEEAFLGFVGAGQPFEIVAQSPFNLQSFAHVDQTTVIWLYWNDLDNWPHFRREVLDAFRYQHQRKLLWLSTLGQRRTIDRLFGFLTLLIEEFGEPCESGYYLPWTLTHAQIGSAIGSTRVTVTRLMGKLRQRKLIHIHRDGLIAIPAHHPAAQQA